MSTTSETLENYEGIDSDKENNNNVLNKEKEKNKYGSDVKHVHQDQSSIQKKDTLSDCKENTCQVDIIHSVNVTDGHTDKKSNEQDNQKVETELVADKAFKRKMKKERQRLKKKVEKINQIEETKIDVTEASKADVEEYKLQNEFIKADSSKMTSKDFNQDSIHKDIENNSNGNDDSDEEIDFLNTIPAFVHAAIKKDNKKLLPTKLHKQTKEDDTTKVNFSQQNVTSETLNNDNDEYYDIDMENDFTLVKYKHSKHPDSLQSSKDFATLAIKLILENQISEAIQHLSTAINLDSKNVCHYANRSFCFLRFGLYNSAIKDAHFVTKNTNDNTILAKANYLLGQAYYGLENYEEAEKSIQKCLDLFPRNSCYIRESLRFKIRQLVNMGFCEKDAALALKTHSTVVDALEKLIAQNDVTKISNNSTDDCDTISISYDETEIFYSDDENNCSNTQLLSSIIKKKFPFRCDRFNKKSSTKQYPTMVVNTKDYMRKKKKLK